MEKIRKKWSSMDLFGKCSYLSVGLLFFLIPFTGGPMSRKSTN